MVRRSLFHSRVKSRWNSCTFSVQNGATPCIVRRPFNLCRCAHIRVNLSKQGMTQPPTKPRHWLLAVDPRVYHWDTLFVKGKEMWRHAGNRPDALRQLKIVRKGDRALCYHGKPEHAIYALAEVSRDPYPDPHDP